MPDENFVEVMLDKDLVQKLLNGLCTGAAGRSLKIVIDIHNRYHVDSKGLQIVIELNEAQDNIARVDVNNGKQCAVVTGEQIAEMNLEHLCPQVVTELKDKYSPSFHSLADNIVVFGRAYGEIGS
jgi:hypothetical protein